MVSKIFLLFLLISDFSSCYIIDLKKFKIHGTRIDISYEIEHISLHLASCLKTILKQPFEIFTEISFSHF